MSQVIDSAKLVEWARREHAESTDLYGRECEFCDRGIYLYKDEGLYRPCVECAPATYGSWSDAGGPNLRDEVKS